MEKSLGIRAQAGRGNPQVLVAWIWHPQTSHPQQAPLHQLNKTLDSWHPKSSKLLCFSTSTDLLRASRMSIWYQDKKYAAQVG